MRRAVKYRKSEILTKDLRYINNNSKNNKKIASILFEEQKRLCAYTEEYLGRADAKDIDHFNPTLKGTKKDNYKNWLLVKHQWNKEKSNKWKDCQPNLHPSAKDFEERIIYDKGDYIANSSLDIEAKNTIKLLKLDDVQLAQERKDYIRRKRKEIADVHVNIETYFTDLISDDRPRVIYLRAIKEEFGIDLWPILS